MTRKLVVFASLGGVFVVVAFIGMLVLVGNERGYAVWTDTALALAAWAGTAAFTWRALQPGPKRIAWILLAVGLGSEAVAETLWWIYEAGMQVEVPFPGGPDLFYLLGYPFLAFGFYRMIPRGASALSHGQAILDSLLITASAFLVSWVLLLDPILSDLGGTSPLEAGVYLAYPLFDLMIVAVALSFMARIPGRGVRPLAMLAGGLLVWVVGDSAYLLLELEGVYGAGYPTDISWAVGYLAMGSVAFFPPGWFEAGLAERPAPWQRLVPLVVTLVALAFGLWNAFAQFPGSAFAVVVAMVVVSSMFFRQGMAIREIERLHRSTALAGQAARAYVENSEDMVLLYGVDQRLKFANPAVGRLTGKPPDQMGNDGIWDLVHPDDIAGAKAAFEKAVETQGRPVGLDLRMRAADGAYRTVAAVVTNQLDNADLRGMLLNVRDITEERERQRDLLLRESTARLAEERQRLINGAAHVLTTPLTPALLHVAALRSEKRGALTEYQLETLDAVDRNLHRLQRTADAIVKAFQLHSGGPAEVLRAEAVHIWDGCVARYDAPSDLAIGEGEAWVDGDPSLMRDAFTAMLEHLDGAEGEARASIDVRRSAETISIVVPEPRADMTEERVQASLDPFVENVEARGGLELYICRTALQKQGGDLTWEDGHWLMSLPVAKEADAPGPRGARPVPATGRVAASQEEEQHEDGDDGPRQTPDASPP